jgi:FixJ family two-component response regulator
MLTSGGPSGWSQVPIVYVVEDDPGSRRATTRYLQAAGYHVRQYGNADDFLAAFSPEAPGCIVLDLDLPGVSGLDLQETLAGTADPPAIVFLSGEGEVPDSVRAMKTGAVDFLTKNSDGGLLLDAIARALASDVRNRADRDRRRSLQERFDALTVREREVFAHLLSGQLNKQIGADLGIAEPTIKIHRRRVLAKMKADSVADLVRMAADLQIAPTGTVR